MTDSASIWLKYKDSYRQTEYSKYQPKKFFEPINVEKEVPFDAAQKQRDDQLREEYPLLDELPRQPCNEIKDKKYEIVSWSNINNYCLGVFLPLTYDEVVHNHYDLEIDAFRDVEHFKRGDQRISRDDFKQLMINFEEKKLEQIKQQMFYSV